MGLENRCSGGKGVKDLGRLETVVREEDNGTEDYRGDRWGDDKLQVGEEGQWRREGQVASGGEKAEL